MKKLIYLLIFTLCVTACTQQKETVNYYNAGEGELLAFADLHWTPDYEKQLEKAAKSYGLYFTIDDIVYFGESNGDVPVAMFIPKDSGVEITVKSFDKEETFNGPVVVFDYGKKLSVKDNADKESQPITIDVDNPYDPVTMLNDMLLFDKEVFTDENTFKQKAYELGYNDETLEYLHKNGYYSKQDEYRLFVLTYGDSRLSAQGHDCYGENHIDSPDGKYTLTYNLYNWGGESMMYAVFFTDNTTGKTFVLPPEYWFSNNKKPFFTDENTFVMYSKENVGIFDVTNPTEPGESFSLKERDKYEILDVYRDKSNGRLVYSIARKITGVPPEPVYYYNFVITDLSGNIIKEIVSDLQVTFAVNSIAQPDFTSYDGQHTDRELKFELWKLGDYSLDLTTGKTVKIR